MLSRIFPFPQVTRTQTKLSCMLEKLGLKYEGRPHSGLNDSRNIAHIAMRMLQDGCQLRINERMHEGQLRTVPSSAPVEGAPPPHTAETRPRLCIPWLWESCIEAFKAGIPCLFYPHGFKKNHSTFPTQSKGLFFFSKLWDCVDSRFNWTSSATYHNVNFVAAFWHPL